MHCFFSNQIDLGTSLRSPFTKSQQMQISLDVVVQHVSNSCKKIIKLSLMDNPLLAKKFYSRIQCKV